MASGDAPVASISSILHLRNKQTGHPITQKPCVKHLHHLWQQKTASISKTTSNKACLTSTEQSTHVHRFISSRSSRSTSKSHQLHLTPVTCWWLLALLTFASLTLSQVAATRTSDFHHYLPQRDANSIDHGDPSPTDHQSNYSLPSSQHRQTKCYDIYGHAQRCVPEFVNAAYLRQVDVTNVCGIDGPSKYCSQTEVGQTPSRCDICDANDTEKAHPAYYLTDVNDNNNTWWQSQTMFEGVQNPKAENPIPQINLTIHLGEFSFSNIFTLNAKCK